MGSLTLPSSGSVYLDANCIVYRVERIQPFSEILIPLFELASAGRIALLTSQLSLLECLVKPVRDGDEELERIFRAVLTESQELRLAPVTLPVWERAIKLRARAGFKTSDAVHAATALEYGCESIVTNDAVFRRLGEIPVQVLGALDA